MKKKQLGRRRRQGTSQPRSCQLGQFHCIGQFPGQYRRWCQVCDDHSVGPGIHRYESCRGVTCQEVYGQNVEQSSKERVAKKETTDEATDVGLEHWGRGAELNGDQVAGLEQHVEAPEYDTDVEESSGAEVAAEKPSQDLGTLSSGITARRKELEAVQEDTDHYGGCWEESEPCQGKVCRYDPEGEYDTDTGNDHKGGAELDEAGHVHPRGGAQHARAQRDVGSPSFCGNCYTFEKARLTDRGYYCNTCIYNSMAKDPYERQGGTPYHTFTEADWERESCHYPTRP